MKRPNIAINYLEKGDIYGPERHFMRVAAKYIKYLESQLQPRKTVKDAVDYFDEVWPEFLEAPSIDGWWFNNNGDLIYFYELGGLKQHYKVCTREEFEAEVERRKGIEITGLDSLTHVAPNGESCRVLYEDNRSQLIEYQDGTRACYFVKSHFATNRKPTISKADAWDKLMAEHENPNGKSIYNTFCEILEQFEAKR